MAAQLSTKLTMDGAQHNETLRNAAKELSKYKREVENTEKQLKEFKRQSQSASGSIDTMAKSLKTGNLKGMFIGANGAANALTGTLTKLGGALGVITTGVSLAQWFSDSVKEGVKLAQEGEGIRLAFERINTGNLLAKLREETHNTVTDLELMRQAVKFNDFKLPTEQLGTLLAFAQQKAKDTGQSIDYMVDSIVTGLGRKSLPILDNLGLSAAEIKERMAEGGDMTKAVADIIREQMDKAGGYVETAADRAKQKEVELQNELEELGRTFQPLTATAGDFFHSVEIGALKAINSLRPLINQFTELGRITNAYQSYGGSDKVNRMIGNLGDGKSKKAFATYKKQIAEFERVENNLQQSINAYNFSGDKSSIAQGNKKRLEENLAAVRKMKNEYIKAANDLHNKVDKPTPKPTSNTKSTKGGKGGKNTPQYAEGSVGWYDEQIAAKQKEIKFQVDSSEIERLQKEIKDLISLREQLMNPIKPLAPVELPKIPNIADQLIPKFDAENLPKLNIPSIVDQYDEIRDKMSRVFDSYDMGIIGAKKAQEFIDELNAQLEALGLKPIKIHVESDAEKTLGDISEVAGQMGDAFSGLGEAMNLPELDVAGIISGTIASVLQGYGTATAQASSLGPWAWIAFAIAGMAQVATMISQIHSLSGYAGGGVIQGRTTIGDYNFARVNAGEMILNTKQQNHLFKMIDEGRTGLHQSMGGEVIFRIHGKDLEGVRRNYNDKMNKVR